MRYFGQAFVEMKFTQLETHLNVGFDGLQGTMQAISFNNASNPQGMCFCVHEMLWDNSGCVHTVDFCQGHTTQLAFHPQVSTFLSDPNVHSALHHTVLMRNFWTYARVWCNLYSVAGIDRCKILLSRVKRWSPVALRYTWCDARGLWLAPVNHVQQTWCNIHRAHWQSYIRKL